MHAIVIRQQKFWDQPQRDDFMKQFMQYGHGAGFVGASQGPNVVNMFYYEKIDPTQLDTLFAAQMDAKDKLIAMPGSVASTPNDLLGNRAVLGDAEPPFDDPDF